MDAVAKEEEAEPAGVLYFSLVEQVIKADKKKAPEEIEEEIRKNFKMKGLVLADVKVVKMMDKSLDKGYSSIVPVYIDKDNNVSEKSSSAISKEQFELLQKYILKTIKNISKEILSGKIDIKPYYKNKKTPCEYCEYKSICQFDKNRFGNEYNYIPQYSKEEIWEKIKEG